MHVATPLAMSHKTKHHHSFPALGIFNKSNYAGTDQGVDFTGAGNIPAIGNGIVTDVGTTSIIEEPGKLYHYVIYRITNGPLKGMFVYIAENIKPRVSKGDRLSFGQTVAHALGAYPYVETGFNKQGKGWSPIAPLYPNPHGAKPAGEAMWTYLQGLMSQQKTRVKINGVWYTVQGGRFVGKQPPNYHGSSYLGELGHYTIHPGQGIGITAGAAGGLLDKGLMKVLYGVAMFGGFLLVITGFAMIGLDLTLGRSSTAKTALKLTGAGAIAGKVSQRRSLRPPTDKELMREYRKGENQGTKQAARREGARVARSRIATPQKLSPEPKY